MECRLCEYWKLGNPIQDWETGDVEYEGWCEKHKEKRIEGSICNDFKERVA